MNFKVLVVGDGCYDIYSYCSVAGLAPDKPIQILKLEKEVRSPGMALNVAANLSSLGVTSKTLSNENWSKIEKNRFVDIKSNHMFCRVDKTEPITRINLNLIDYDCDAIIISDYDKGFVTEYLCQGVIKYANENNIPTFVDPKIKNFSSNILTH